MTQHMSSYATITRKASPVAAIVGRPLRWLSGGCIGLALGRSLFAKDWTDVLLALAIAFTAFASVVMHFEVSDDDV
jgi:hypothetical protein